MNTLLFRYYGQSLYFYHEFTLAFGNIGGGYQHAERTDLSGCRLIKLIFLPMNLVVKRSVKLQDINGCKKYSGSRACWAILLCRSSRCHQDHPRKFSSHPQKPFQENIYLMAQSSQEELLLYFAKLPIKDLVQQSHNL